MKKIEQRPYTQTVNVVVELKCDLCGKPAIHLNAQPWAERAFDVSETRIELRDGKSYPEGGNATVTIFDICPDCFRTKLMPWIAAQGGQPTVTETDW